MPPSWLFNQYQQNKERINGKNLDGVTWNVNVLDFEEVIGKGCFFCSKVYTEADRIKAYIMSGLDYKKHNMITLCDVCHPMVKKNDIVPLAKQIIHIGSKLDQTQPKVEYPDAFINNTSQCTFDGYIKKMNAKFEHSRKMRVDENAPVFVNHITAAEYSKIVGNNCTFCDRPDTTANRTNVTIKKDNSVGIIGYNNSNKNFITICRPCATLYNYFDTHTKFVTHIKLCAKNLRPKIGLYISNKIFVKNPSLYINHSNVADGKVTFDDAAVRIDELELGVWSVKVSSKAGTPLIDLTSEFYKDSVRYERDIVTVSRGSDFIDSICLTPYKLTKAKIFDEVFSLSAIGASFDIDKIIRGGRYPGFVEGDSTVYAGLPCRNTKMRVVMDYDTTVKRIRFYCNYESVTFCQCRNTCEQCKGVILKAMVEEENQAVSLRADIDVNGNNIENRFIKNTKTVYGITAASLNLKKAANETVEEFHKRTKREVSAQIRAIKYSGSERERNLKIKNDKQTAKRRAAGMKARKPVGDDPEVYQQAYKQRQAEKHGTEGVRELNRLYRKIARARKKPNFPAHTLKKLEDEYARLKNG